MTATVGRAPAAGLFFRPPDPLAATSSKEARQAAVQAIPFEHIDEDDRGRVANVLRQTSIYRRMPIQVIDCDPNLYLFLLRNPDVVVNIWRVLGISKLDVQRDDSGEYLINEPDGTKCRARFVYRGPDTHVIYGEGTYRGPVLGRTLHGRCVIVLRSGYVREPNRRYYISTRMDAFVQIDDTPAELLTKTLFPVVTKTAESNFEKTLGFVGSFSRTAEANSRGVQRLATKLTKVDPELRRRLARLAADMGRNTPTAVGKVGAAGAMNGDRELVLAQEVEASGPALGESGGRAVEPSTPRPTIGRIIRTEHLQTR